MCWLILEEEEQQRNMFPLRPFVLLQLKSSLSLLVSCSFPEKSEIFWSTCWKRKIPHADSKPGLPQQKEVKKYFPNWWDRNKFWLRIFPKMCFGNLLKGESQSVHFDRVNPQHLLLLLVHRSSLKLNGKRTLKAQTVFHLERRKQQLVSMVRTAAAMTAWRFNLLLRFLPAAVVCAVWLTHVVSKAAAAASIAAAAATVALKFSKLKVAAKPLCNQGQLKRSCIGLWRKCKLGLTIFEQLWEKERRKKKPEKNCLFWMSASSMFEARRETGTDMGRKIFSFYPYLK